MRGLEPLALGHVRPQRPRGQRAQLAAELLRVVGVDVAAAARLGDALQLAPGARLHLEADGLDLEVDAALGDLLRDVARVGRLAVVAAVGHEHDGLLLGRPEVLDGALQRGPDRREAARLQGVDLPLQAVRSSAATGETSFVSAQPACRPVPLTSEP